MEKKLIQFFSKYLNHYDSENNFLFFNRKKSFHVLK